MTDMIKRVMRAMLLDREFSNMRYSLSECQGRVPTESQCLANIGAGIVSRAATCTAPPSPRRWRHRGGDRHRSGGRDDR